MKKHLRLAWFPEHIANADLSPIPMPREYWTHISRKQRLWGRIGDERFLQLMHLHALYYNFGAIPNGLMVIISYWPYVRCVPRIHILAELLDRFFVLRRDGWHAKRLDWLRLDNPYEEASS